MILIQLDALQTIDRTNKLCWCRFELLLPILCYLTICPDFIFFIVYLLLQFKQIESQLHLAVVLGDRCLDKKSLKSLRL